MEVTADIKPTVLQSAFVIGSFDQTKYALGKAGYRIISLAENAQLRIQQGKDAYVSQNGNLVSEDFVYIPGKGRFLTKNSIINNNPVMATNIHRENKEFYITSEKVSLALENAVEIHTNTTNIPVKRFGENDIAVFAFGSPKQAQAYGDFLSEAGKNEMPLLLVNSDCVNQRNQPFVRKCWFGGLGEWSDHFGLIGNAAGLNFSTRLRGVSGMCKSDSQ